MNENLIDYIYQNRPDVGLDKVEDGVMFYAGGSEIPKDVIDTLQLELEAFEKEAEKLEIIATIEAIYSRQVIALFKRASALPTQPIRRMTEVGQSTQNLVYQTHQMAESLGLITVLSDIQKQAMVEILPWLELASKICDKLTTDALAGVDISAKIIEAKDLTLKKEDLTYEKLLELKTQFGVI